MVLTEADKSRNLLTVVHAQHVTPEQLDAGFAKVELLLADLQPGFRLLADLSGLESMDPSCAPLIGQVMDLFNRKGVSMVVRIIPDPKRDIGLNILSLFHYSRKVRIVTVESFSEATEILSKE
jgi:hypothetical protein